MKFKKAQTGGDYISFVIFGIFGTLIIMSFVLFAFIPSMKGRMQNEIKSKMEDVQSNLFLLYYLNYDVDNQNIVDIISVCYAKEDYAELEFMTKDALKKLYGDDVKWKILINDKEIVEQCGNFGCRGRSNDYGISLPTRNQDTISFEIKIYAR